MTVKLSNKVDAIYLPEGFKEGLRIPCSGPQHFGKNFDISARPGAGSQK